MLLQQSEEDVETQLQYDTQTAVSQLQLFGFTSGSAQKQVRVERQEWGAEGKKGEIYK